MKAKETNWIDDVLKITGMFKRRAEEAQEEFRKSLDERGFPDSIGFAGRVVLYSEQWEMVRSMDDYLRNSEDPAETKAATILKDIADQQRSTFHKHTATSTNAFHNAVDNCRLDAHLRMFRTWGGELLAIKEIIEKSQEVKTAKAKA